MCSHASFCFGALCTNIHTLRVKLGQTLTNRGPGFGSDKWMPFLLTYGSANCMKKDFEGEIK